MSGQVNQLLVDRGIKDKVTGEQRGTKVSQVNKFTSRQVNELLVDRVNEDKVTEEQSSFK